MTTTITTAHEQWAAAINAEGLAVLPAYADWLEERGDELARVWRWLAERGKRPRIVAVLAGTDGFLCRFFSRRAKARNRHRLPLHAPKYHEDVDGIHGEWRRYTTLFAAYDAAARALAAAYPEEIPTP